MIRGIGMRGAVAINVITMIGIGPLITIPLVLADLHGATALAAWVVGALLALCDGLAWAELGSLYPGSGGTYVFLREIFGPQRWGRLLAFLFAWQILLSGPLLLASGYIGFAHYAGYLWAPLAADDRLQGVVAAGVGVLTLGLLYRPIRTVGTIGVGLAGVVHVGNLGVVRVGRERVDDVRVGEARIRDARIGDALVGRAHVLRARVRAGDARRVAPRFARERRVDAVHHGRVEVGDRTVEVDDAAVLARRERTVRDARADRGEQHQ